MLQPQAGAQPTTRPTVTPRATVVSGPVATIRTALRLSVAATGVAGAVLLSGVAIGPNAIAGYSTLRATTAVNIRSAPSTASSVLGVLYLGGTVTQTGAEKSGFVPVTWNGRSAWIAADYVTGVKANESAPVSQSGATGTRIVQEALNVRSGPSVTAGLVGLLPRGATVTLTGLVNANYSQIVYKDSRAWVATAWLGASSPTSGTQLTAKSQARATADLMIRTTSGTNFTSLGDIPKGTILNLTGTTATGVAQIIWQGSLRWVNANYLAPVNSSTGVVTPSLPAVIGTQYATTALDIRTSSGSDSVTLTEVPTGTALSITGTVQNGRAQVVYQGAVRWVTAQYLSATKPSASDNLSPTYGGSVGLVGLAPDTQQLLVSVRGTWPQIRTIYGIRPDSIPDHPSGHALDLMLPDYTSPASNALGWQIANWARANAASLNIQYIIFDQHIWNIARDSEGWRLMADRGSDTANHVNHVHITTKS